MNFLMQNIEDLKAMLPQLQTLRPQVDAATAAIAESLLAGGKCLRPATAAAPQMRRT